MDVKSVVVLADARSFDEAVRAESEARDALGPLDILVYSVGMCPLKSFLELTPEDWHEVFATIEVSINHDITKARPASSKRQ